MDSPERIRLFANGTEFQFFDELNCGRCKKCATDYAEDGPCDLQNAMLDSQMDSGEVTLEIAVRIGYVVDGKRVRGIPDCKERELK